MAKSEDDESSLVRDALLIGVPALLLVVGAFWLAFQYVDPAPPRRVVIATGSQQGAYFAFGKRYSDILARSGVHLEVRDTAGSVENIARIREPGNGVQLALLQGGIADEKTAPELVSLGRMFLEPVWVFTRADLKVSKLVELRGSRIAIGPDGSGTRKLAESLLARSGIGADAAKLLPLSGAAAAEALRTGDADAVFLVMAAESPLVQALLRDPAVRVVSLAQAEAYTRVFPYLSRVVLPQGVIDLSTNIPAEDVVLLAAQAALVAREDLHPAIVALMTDAAQEVHGGSGLFQRPGDFPRKTDPEFQMSDDALRTYKSGQPFLRRFLPFWVAVLAERLMVLAVPLATVLIPLIRFVPRLYQWRIRQRILRWYGQLKKLEGRLNADPDMTDRTQYIAEIDRIDHAAAHIPVPVRYADQYYDLRSAIDFVRRRIEVREAAMRGA